MFQEQRITYRFNNRLTDIGRTVLKRTRKKTQATAQHIADSTGKKTTECLDRVIDRAEKAYQSLENRAQGSNPSLLSRVGIATNLIAHGHTNNCLSEDLDGKTRDRNKKPINIGEQFNPFIGRLLNRTRIKKIHHAMAVGEHAASKSFKDFRGDLGLLFKKGYDFEEVMRMIKDEKFFLDILDNIIDPKIAPEALGDGLIENARRAVDKLKEKIHPESKKKSIKNGSALDQQLEKFFDNFLNKYDPNDTNRTFNHFVKLLKNEKIEIEEDGEKTPYNLANYDIKKWLKGKTKRFLKGKLKEHIESFVENSFAYTYKHSPNVRENLIANLSHSCVNFKDRHGKKISKTAILTGEKNVPEICEIELDQDQLEYIYHKLFKKITHEEDDPNPETPIERMGKLQKNVIKYIRTVLGYQTPNKEGEPIEHEIKFSLKYKDRSEEKGKFRDVHKLINDYPNGIDSVFNDTIDRKLRFNNNEMIVGLDPAIIVPSHVKDQLKEINNENPTKFLAKLFGVKENTRTIHKMEQILFVAANKYLTNLGGEIAAMESIMNCNNYLSLLQIADGVQKSHQERFAARVKVELVLLVHNTMHDPRFAKRYRHAKAIEKFYANSAGLEIKQSDDGNPEIKDVEEEKLLTASFKEDPSLSFYLSTVKEQDHDEGLTWIGTKGLGAILGKRIRKRDPMTKMKDILRCRAVVKTIDDAKKLVAILEKRYVNTGNTIKILNDYGNEIPLSEFNVNGNGHRATSYRNLTIVVVQKVKDGREEILVPFEFQIQLMDDFLATQKAEGMESHQRYVRDRQQEERAKLAPPEIFPESYVSQKSEDDDLFRYGDQPQRIYQGSAAT